LLRAAGVLANAAHAADLAPYGQRIDPSQAVVLLSHTAKTGYSMEMLTRAREAGAPTVLISGIGAGGDLETVAMETSYAYTASHTGALMRLAQLATLLGADLGPLTAVPDAIGRVLENPRPLAELPERLVEIIGAGANAWTAQEAALKIREASYVAAEGLSAEQFFHGPSVALDERDLLLVLDGGGPMAARTDAISSAVAVGGARVIRFADRDLGEVLSIFPLTALVQRVALEFAEAREVSPDRFRYDEDPRREQAFESLGF
jgi:glucosamine--fructose-6-phosphate aminotransferase (isomerizing)